jgi:hypothetical protein
LRATRWSPGERVLEDLLRRLRVAGQSVGGPVDRRPVAHEECLERAEIVGLHPDEQGGIFGAGAEAFRVLDRLARRRLLTVVDRRPSPGSDW